MTVKEFRENTNFPEWKTTFFLITDKGEKSLSFERPFGWVDDETFDGSDAKIIIERERFNQGEIVSIEKKKFFIKVKVKL